MRNLSSLMSSHTTIISPRWRHWRWRASVSERFVTPVSISSLRLTSRQNREWYRVVVTRCWITPLRRRRWLRNMNLWRRIFWSGLSRPSSSSTIASLQTLWWESSSSFRPLTHTARWRNLPSESGETLDEQNLCFIQSLSWIIVTPCILVFTFVILPVKASNGSKFRCQISKKGSQTRTYFSDFNVFKLAASGI